MAWPFSKRTAEPVLAPQRAEPEFRESSIPKIARRRTFAPGSRGRRYYDGGGSDRHTTGWTKTPLSADEIIDRNQAVLVARSREQAANNDYLKSFIRNCDLNVVGPKGIILSAQAKDESGTLDNAANEALQAWWRKWSLGKNCDIKGRRSFRMLCKAAIKTAAKDGEFMFREIRGRAAPMGYALQTIDPQRCPVDYNIDNLKNGRFIRQGIEFTREGRAVAYWFRSKTHSHYTATEHRLERVPADQIIHGFIEEIEGQRRGIPWAATSLWRLNQLHEFEKAALVNARMGASVGGFLEWDKDEGPMIEPEEDGEEHEEAFIEPEAGVFQELAPGLRHKAFDSRYPTGDFTPFHKAMLRGAGSGMGVAYVNFANDLEGVNFSSIRQGVLNEREHWMDLQEWLIETLVDRAYQAALEIALLKGIVTNGKIRLRAERVAKYRNVLWQPRRWAWVDPTKDINAEVTAMENMLTSPSEIIRKSGRDPTAVWQAFAADIEAMKQASIPENIIMATLFKNGGPIAPRSAPPKKKEGITDDETD